MALDETIGLLERVPLIGRFQRDALRLLAFSAETRRLRPGDMLFSRGDRSDGGYVLLAGEIEVTSGGAGRRAGSEPDAVVGPGALLGRLALVMRMKRPSSARARTACELMRISPTLLRRIIAEFPDTAERMHDEMAADLAELTRGLDGVRGSLLEPVRRPKA